MLSGCGGGAHLSFLDPQGPIAAAERWHFYWVLGIMAILVAGPIFVVLPFFLWRYRHTNQSARYRPRWKFSKPLEILSWAGPIVIVIVLSVLVWRDAHKLDPYKPIASDKPALNVQVIGYDWKWLFIYPDQGIASIGKLVVPAQRPVSLHLTSATAMQSFFIPALGSQVYAMGGMVTQLHLMADNPGHFLGENTMYNGNGFHAQKFIAVATTPAGFQSWVSRVRAAGVPISRKVMARVSRQSTRSQLAAALPDAATDDGDIYLTHASPSLFLKIVQAVKEGSHAPLTAAAKPAREKQP
jgi:cytochrome o ubiquinol oxidase subunit 2